MAGFRDNIDEIGTGGGASVAQDQVLTSWVIFDSSDSSIIDSYNVSSVAQNDGTGWTITFENAMDSADYSIHGSAEQVRIVGDRGSSYKSTTAYEVEGFNAYENAWTRSVGIVYIMTYGGVAEQVTVPEGKTLIDDQLVTAWATVDSDGTILQACQIHQLDFMSLRLLRVWMMQTIL